MKWVCALVACFLAVSTALPVGTWTGELQQLSAHSVNASSYTCMPEVHNADVTVVFTTTGAKLVIAPGSRVASDSITYTDVAENSDWLLVSDNSTGGCLRLNHTTQPDRYFRYQIDSEGAVNETLWMSFCTSPGCPAVGTAPSCDSGLGEYCFRLKLWRHKYKLCDTYCNRYLVGCNGNQGGASSYTDRANCLANCNGFPSGLQVMAEVDEQKYNTTECRTYHVGVALGSGALANTHCPHASPSGGGVCAGASDPCTRYCDRVMDVAPCSTQNLYADKGACMTACAAFSFQAAPDSKTGDNFFCRYYFASAAALTQNALFCSTAGPTGIGRVGGMATLPMAGTCQPDWTAPWIAAFATVPRICKAGRVLGECCCGIGFANLTKLDHNFLNLYAPISGGQPCLGSSVLEIPGFFLDTPTHAKASVQITNPPVNFEVDLILQRNGNEMKLTNSLQPTCLGLSCKNLNGDCTPPGPADSTGPDPNTASRVVSPLAALVAVLAVALLA